MAAAILEKIKSGLSLTHLVGLCGFAVAGPVYDLLARHPAFLTAHGLGAWDLVWLCIALSVLLPLVVWATIRIFSAITPVAAAIGSTALGFVLIALFSLPIPWWINSSLPIWPGGFLAVAIACGLGWFLLNTAVGKSLLTMLGYLALVFPAWFLLQPVVVGQFGVSGSTAVSVDIDQPTDVVMLVFDELPTTALVNGQAALDDRYFPNFARLANRATWFRNATTNATLTEFAIPALLSGNLPDTSSRPVTDFASVPNNLFNLLAGTYQLHVHEPITRLCAPRLCDESGVDWPAVTFDLGLIYVHRVTPPVAREILPSIDGRWSDFRRVSAVDLAEAAYQAGRFNTLSDFISNIGTTSDEVATGAARGKGARSNTPTLHFFHSMLPHSPYQYLPSGHRMISFRESRGLETIEGQRRWSLETGAVDEARGLFLRQLMAVDTLVGLLIDRLDGLGRFDETLIIVTADHGISFRPGDLRRRVSRSNQWDIAAVPLLIKFPRQTEGEIDFTNVESIDVLPLIAETLGIELPWPVDGDSPRKGPVAAYASTNHRQDQRPKKQLFDVRTPMALPPRIPAVAFTPWWSPGSDYDSAVQTPPGDVRACDGISADLVNARFLKNVVPEEFFPAHMVGHLTGPLPDGEILIEMNGRVVAAGTKSVSNDEFFAFVDEKHFVRGQNMLRVLVHDNNRWCYLFRTP